MCACTCACVLDLSACVRASFAARRRRFVSIFDRVLFCFRRAFLVDEYVKEKQLSFDEEGQYRRKMLRKESYYLRLRRQKSHINDFNILTLIGMLLSWNVCFVIYKYMLNIVCVCLYKMR